MNGSKIAPGRTVISAGEFVNVTGKMIVSDPCYCELKHGHCMWIGIVVKGKWEAEVEIFDEKEWGKRVSRLEARKAGRNDGAWEAMRFDICVDSGQMSIVDYFEGFGSGEYDDIKSWYGSACKTTLEKKFGVVEWKGQKIGVVSESGFGDGGYDGFVKVSNGEVVGLKVVFIHDEVCVP